MLRAKHMTDNQTRSRSNKSGAVTVPNHTYWNPKAVRNLYLASAPVISHAAVAILSVAGSEAAVERTFSAQGAVHTKTRNRLLDATVEQEMFVKFNGRALAAEVKGEYRGNYIELDEEMEIVEPVPRLGVLWGQGGAAADSEAEMMVEEQQAADVEEKQESEAPPQSVISQIDPPPPAVDDERRFIETYVRDNGIYANYKWPEHRMAHLSDAAVCFTPSIRTMDIVLRRKIMAYVRAEQISEDVDMSVAV
jgi:hAT family C-terminal dimerisation region